MKNLLNIYDDRGWEKAEGYPTGTKIKNLRDEDGAKTILLKVPKHFFMAAHSHVTTEQHVVIRGEYRSEGKIYYSGAYQLIPAGMDHGPFESPNGAVILIVWDPYKKNE